MLNKEEPELKSVWTNLKSSKDSAIMTKNRKLVYEPGTIHTASDGRKYIVDPNGSWRRYDKLKEAFDGKK